jgi:hypothetical protein
MAGETIKRTISRIDDLDQHGLEQRLRDAARTLDSQRVMDDLEVRHLVRVITECSLLLSDVYSEQRISRIMHPERGFLNNLIDQLIDQERRDDGEVLYRVRRLPDDVRVIGDKALFDLGLSGQQHVKGYDLEELGVRAYRVAGEVLEALAEDRRLRKFFEQNRLQALPLEEEVIFLRQCSEKFRVYAEILKRSHGVSRSGSSLADMADGVPLVTVGSSALVRRDTMPNLPMLVQREGLGEDRYLAASRGDGTAEMELTREQQISAYERVLLFSALDMERLKNALDATVINQERAVETLCDEFSLFAAGTRDPRKPPAYFLVGPTGVGKNHLVESLLRTLSGIWKTDIPMLTIEGPNYTYPSDINELRGATRGFIRSDEEGLLTTFHKKSSQAPFSVMLIDEVEKAHPSFLSFFLSILDRGTTTDNRGSVLNFSNCMLFFTSNLGYSDAQQQSTPIGYMDEAARVSSMDDDIRRTLRQGLKPEFINRVRLVHFNRLTERSIEKILDLEMKRIFRRYAELHGLRIELMPSARAELVKRGFSPIYGARHLSATLEGICNVEIAKIIRRDDRNAQADRDELVGWLREMRSGGRPFDGEEVKNRVEALAKAHLDYDTLKIVFEDGEFQYVPEAVETMY